MSEAMGKIKKNIKQGASKIKKTAGWARKELSDRRILDLASVPYSKIKKKIRTTKSTIDNIDLDSKVAMQLGEQILNRAQAVRKSIKIKKTRTDDSEE